MDATDQRLLRETFRLAREARACGNRPFGALLAGPDRAVLLEAWDTVVTERDRTAHAGSNLLRAACRESAPDFLRRCTLYASTEPCAMCAGAVFWAGVGRVVFGLSTATLVELTGGGKSDRPRLAVPCRGVLAGARPGVEVTGPIFQAEAMEAHGGYWAARWPLEHTDRAAGPLQVPVPAG